MYSPLRSDATARAERDRLMEDIRFVAKSVRFYSSSFPFFSIPHTRGAARRGVGSMGHADRKRVHNVK